ncbi:hypothetical protein CW745_06515 [Psychromonas sp. psych-6C06]|nr:hypothetical protein CW745_06515 [Psychromonas sp. psych-6C06]
MCIIKVGKRNVLFSIYTIRGSPLFPKNQKKKLLRGKKVLATEALFPSYLFVHLEQDNCNFNSLRSTRGVNSFIRFGGQMAKHPMRLFLNYSRFAIV